MLEWLLKTHGDTAKRLKAVQIEACRLEGGLAALEAAIQQTRKEAASGNGAASVTTQPIAEPPAVPASSEYEHLGTPKTVMPALTGINRVVKTPHGPLQAETELRE